MPEGVALAPGTYATLFEPAFTLTVTRGQANIDGASWVDYTFGHDPTFEMGVTRIDMVFDPKHPANLIEPPRDLTGWIAKLPGLAVVAPPKNVTVGGLDARQLDVLCGDEDVPFAPIPGVDDPPNGLAHRHAARLIAMVVQGHQILIAFGADEQSNAHFNAAVTAFQPLIDSIVWR